MQQGWINKPRNFVSKHMRTFNKSSIQVDKKKEMKRGKIKHKGKKYGL